MKNHYRQPPSIRVAGTSQPEGKSEWDVERCDAAKIGTMGMLFPILVFPVTAMPTAQMGNRLIFFVLLMGLMIRYQKKKAKSKR